MAETMGAYSRTIADPHGKTVTLARQPRIYVLGTILCVALIVSSRSFGDRGGRHFMVALTVAGVAYLFAVREFFATPRLSSRVIVFGLALAVVWHVEFLRLPPGVDDDIHRYVWDGRLQRLGYNPYLVIPSDPSFRALHTSETRNLNNSDLPSPYPPGAQLFFRAVTALRESTFSLKVAFVLCDFAIVVVLFDLLRQLGQPLHLVLAFAWNPLLAIEVAGSGHIDIVGALLLVISAAALARRWRTIGAVSFGLAIAVKFLPIVLIPLYWKRVRVRDAALAALLVGLLYVPFVNHGHIPTGSLRAYVQGFRFNGPIFAAFDQVAPASVLACLAVFAGLATATWLRRKLPAWSPRAFAWPMAASLLCAPAVFPWYLLWLLPFLTSPSTWPLLAWTVAIGATYVQWHLRALTGLWGALPRWVMLFEYGFIAASASIIWLTRPGRASRHASSVSATPELSSKTASVQFTEEERS